MKYDSFSLFEKNVPPIVLCCNCSWKILVNVSIATYPESVFVHSRVTGHVEPSDRVALKDSVLGDTVLARLALLQKPIHTGVLPCTVLSFVG